MIFHECQWQSMKPRFEDWPPSKTLRFHVNHTASGNLQVQYQEDTASNDGDSTRVTSFNENYSTKIKKMNRFNEGDFTRVTLFNERCVIYQ